MLRGKVDFAWERNNPLFVGMKYIPMKRIRARMTIAEVIPARILYALELY